MEVSPPKGTGGLESAMGAMLNKDGLSVAIISPSLIYELSVRLQRREGGNSAYF